jgi:hypothetical protein
MPRGQAKATLFIHRAARRIGQTEGRRRLGILTAVDDDANARSGAVRAIVASERFAEVFPWARRGVVSRHWTDEHPTVRGAEDAVGKDYTVRSMGLRSVRAGARLDDLLADDMVRLHENATPGQREHASRTSWAVVDPMVVPGGTRWFLGTRWHEDDLYAELMRKGWPVMLRQAIGPDGTALWPSFWSLDALEAKRAELGSATSPRPVGKPRPGPGILRMACHEEVDEVSGLGALGVRQPGEASVRRPAESELPELVREPGALDPPERLKELDEPDAGRIGCPQEIGRRRARPRRPARIEECGHVPGIAAQRRAEGAHREATARKDVAKPGSELVVGWGHCSILPVVASPDPAGCWKREADVL